MQATAISAIAAGVSATVALVSAVVAAVSAVHSRAAKREAEQRASEAVRAAQSVATDVGRIARIQETRQHRDTSAQAEQVAFTPSPVMGGRTGWRISNDSGSSISNVRVRSTTGAQIVVYHGSGPEPTPEHVEAVIGAHQPSQFMFRPEKVVDDLPEIDQMAVAFTDARDQRWRRTGSQAPRPLDH